LALFLSYWENSFPFPTDLKIAIGSSCEIPKSKTIDSSKIMTNLIEYEDASDEVRAIYDDIRATRQTDYINNFWKALANHPPT
jgi:hypothetical protein